MVKRRDERGPGALGGGGSRGLAGLKCRLAFDHLAAVVLDRAAFDGRRRSWHDDISGDAAHACGQRDAPAWFPELCVTTPRAAIASLRFFTALQAPRNLNAPAF